jgi:hypothetical protein
MATFFHLRNCVEVQLIFFAAISLPQPHNLPVAARKRPNVPVLVRRSRFHDVEVVLH